MRVVATGALVATFIALAGGCAGNDSEPSPSDRAGADRALVAAARAGDAEVVRSLLEDGAGVEAADATGATALIAASYGGHESIADQLIAAGADVDRQDDTQQSAFLIATSDGHLELLRATLRAGADVRRLDSYRGTGLIRAAERGHTTIVRELLTTDIAFDHVNRLGWTALLEAIILGDGSAPYAEIVRVLIEAGADPGLADRDGVTPLEHAERAGHSAIAGILEQTLSS